MDSIEMLAMQKAIEEKNNFQKQNIRKSIENVGEVNEETAGAVSGIVEDIIPNQDERIEELTAMVDEIISDIIPSIIDENYN